MTLLCGFFALLINWMPVLCIFILYLFGLFEESNKKRLFSLKNMGVLDFVV